MQLLTEVATYAERALLHSVHEGFCYFAGGVGQGNKVFYTSLESLIASTHSAAVGDVPVWKTLPDAPFKYSTPVIFGKQLTTVGGLHTPAIHVYHPIKKWVCVGDLPVAFSRVCSLVLPTTGELVMVGGKEISSHVFRTKIQGKFYKLSVISLFSRLTLEE